MWSIAYGDMFVYCLVVIYSLSNVCCDVMCDHRAASVLERPVCQCGLHVAFSRPRLAMLSDSVRNNIYLHALQKVSVAMKSLVIHPSYFFTHSHQPAVLSHVENLCSL